MDGALSIWRDARLRVLLAAQLASNIGDWLFTLALFALMGIRWHASPLNVSVALVCNLAPSILLGPLAGAVADRTNRKGLILLTNGLSALLLLAIVEADTILEVDILLALLGALEAFFSPAELSLLKAYVPDEEMKQAMAARTVIGRGTQLLGPVMSGVLVGLFGSRTPFFVDAASFAAASFLLLFLPADGARIPAEGTRAQRGALLSASLTGWRTIGGVAPLRRLVLLYVALLFGINLVDAQLVILLRQSAHPAEMLGLMMSSSGAGMVGAAALWMRRSPGSLRLQVSFGAIVMGASTAAQALLIRQHATTLAPLAALLLGAGSAVSFITLQTALQRRIPKEHTGRVMGGVRSLGGAATVGGPLVGGLLSGGLGVLATFLLSGGFLVALGAFALLLRYGPKEVVEGAEGALGT